MDPATSGTVDLLNYAWIGIVVIGAAWWLLGFRKPKPPCRCGPGGFPVLQPHTCKPKK